MPAIELTSHCLAIVSTQDMCTHKLSSVVSHRLEQNLGNLLGFEPRLSQYVVSRGLQTISHSTEQARVIIQQADLMRRAHAWSCWLPSSELHELDRPHAECPVWVEGLLSPSKRLRSSLLATTLTPSSLLSEST